MSFLGLGKTLFNSSVCVLDDSNEPEIFLTERLSRKKAAGEWPSLALQQARNEYQNLKQFQIYENRDVDDPYEIELRLNKKIPFFEFLKTNELDFFSRHFNNQIKFATHHLCHASAARYMSPFNKALILVIDGAGSRGNLFDSQHSEFNLINVNNLNSSAEERSVYLLDNGHLQCVKKEFQTFYQSKKHPEHYFSNGLGSFYEKASEFIFNSKRSAGKVMGLAALASKPANSINDPAEYLENLNWNLQFKGKSKKEWQESSQLELYKQVAIDVQTYFEKNYLGYLENLKELFPEYSHLIITGGCALNCTSNMKLYNKKIFSQVYVPPFPGDESISLGAASLAQNTHNNIWQARNTNIQHGYFGPKASTPSQNTIFDIFSDFEIHKPDSITELAAQLLADGHVLAWFQDRSESGPRSLGNRSLLCRPDIKGIKNYLNDKIKFRESFRPYGCSVLHEKATQYFEVPPDFDNPYMSFATTVRDEYKLTLNEVMHLDGTSRMQTVRKTQNERFYQLLENFGHKTNLFCLLNTSFNIMGEPIVETAEDAANFLKKVPVYGLIIGDYFIKSKLS